MLAADAAARYGPSIAAIPIIPLVVGQPFDLWWAIFVPLGLLLGWMARAGRMVQDRRSWADIRRDLLVNVLIGGANAVMAGLIIWYLHLAYLPGVGVAFGCAFGGVPTLYTMWTWGWRHFSADAAAAEKIASDALLQREGDARQEQQRRASEVYLRREMTELRDNCDDGE